jgi:hypothetical protein
VTLAFFTGQDHWSASGSWSVAGTSSGDGVFDSADLYAVMSNPAEPSSAAMAWVVAGAGASVTPFDAGTGSQGEWTWFWSDGDLTLGPGQKAVLLRFVVQRPHGQTAEAEQQAAALASLSDPLVREEALAGLTLEERGAIVNFVVAP